VVEVQRVVKESVHKESPLKPHVYEVGSWNEVPEHLKYVSSGVLSPPPLPDLSQSSEQEKLAAISEYYRKIAESPLVQFSLKKKEQDEQFELEKQALKNEITNFAEYLKSNQAAFSDEVFQDFANQLQEIHEELTKDQTNTHRIQELRILFLGIKEKAERIVEKFESQISELRQLESTRSLIESTFDGYDHRIMSEVGILSEDQQNEIRLKLDELLTRIGVATLLEEWQSIQSGMEELQVEVDKLVAEQILLRDLKAAPTVLAEKKQKQPNILQKIGNKLKTNLIGENAGDRVREVARFAMFIEGVATPFLLSLAGVHPESVMLFASGLSSLSLLAHGALGMGEHASPMIEARFPKASERIRKLCSVKSIGDIFYAVRKVTSIPMAYFTGLMAGGLLDQAAQMIPHAYHWVHLPTFHMNGGGLGENPATTPSHGGELHNGQDNSNGGDAPIKPPEIGTAVSVKIYDTIPANGQSISQHELNFLSGHIPPEHNTGAVNLLKNLDKALNERMGNGVAWDQPSNGSYTLLDRDMAQKALDAYVDAMQKLPNNWTVGQLDDPQYGLTDYQKIILRAGYGGQYVTQSEFQTVISSLEGVK